MVRNIHFPIVTHILKKIVVWKVYGFAIVTSPPPSFCIQPSTLGAPTGNTPTTGTTFCLGRDSGSYRPDLPRMKVSG